MKKTKVLISIAVLSFPAITVASDKEIKAGVYYKVTPQIAQILGLDLTKINIGPNEQVVFRVNETGEVIDLRSIEKVVENVDYLQMADHGPNGDGGGGGGGMIGP